MIIAVDKGTAYTKTSELISFKSTIRKYSDNELNFSQDKIIVEYDKKKYVIGSNGKTNTNLFKSKHDETKLLVLTAIALSYPEESRIQTHLVTGLPIGRIGYEKDDMKRLFQYTHNAITVNNQKYIVDIGVAEIFPEGASSFYHLEDIDSGLIIDIGGLSIDVALYTRGRKLEKYSTYRLGVLPLYREIANYLGSKYSLTLNEWNVEEILKEGLFIDGNKVDLDISHIVNAYVQQIIQALEFDYNIPQIQKIFLTGGGGEFLYSYIKKIIPRSQLMNNPRFTNVLTYKLLGEVLFNG